MDSNSARPTRTFYAVGIVVLALSVGTLALGLAEDSGVAGAVGLLAALGWFALAHWHRREFR